MSTLLAELRQHIRGPQINAATIEDLLLRVKMGDITDRAQDSLLQVPVAHRLQEGMPGLPPGTSHAMAVLVPLMESPSDPYSMPQVVAAAITPRGGMSVTNVCEPELASHPMSPVEMRAEVLDLIKVAVQGLCSIDGQSVREVGISLTEEQFRASTVHLALAAWLALKAGDSPECAAAAVRAYEACEYGFLPMSTEQLIWTLSAGQSPAPAHALSEVRAYLLHSAGPAAITASQPQEKPLFGSESFWSSLSKEALAYWSQHSTEDLRQNPLARAISQLLHAGGVHGVNITLRFPDIDRLLEVEPDGALRQAPPWEASRPYRRPHFPSARRHP